MLKGRIRLIILLHLNTTGAVRCRFMLFFIVCRNILDSISWQHDFNISFLMCNNNWIMSSENWSVLSIIEWEGTRRIFFVHTQLMIHQTKPLTLARKDIRIEKSMNGLHRIHDKMHFLGWKGSWEMRMKIRTATEWNAAQLIFLHNQLKATIIVLAWW